MSSWYRRPAGCLIVCVGLLSSCGTPSEQPPVAAGTLSAERDADGDGILDEWETGGLDYIDPSDGSTQRLDLKAMGASPAHKDIILWLAWMESATHTHQPDSETIAIVQRAFRTAPVTNPDGFPGINVHVVRARAAVAEDQTLGSGDAARYDWTEFDAIKGNRLPAVLHGTAFFTVFAHYITPARNSGIARSIPGRDFIVSLGGFTADVGTRQEKAGTLMHELGHVLGLRHGGADDVAYKPNYLSVMNYSFQLNGVAISGVPGNFDYSRFRIDITEPTLNENTGLDAGPSLARYSTIFFCCTTCTNTPGQPAHIASIASSPVDWNCDRTFGPRIASDINRDNAIRPLSGASDWQNIVLKGSGEAGISANEVGTTPGDELTPEEADRVPLVPVANVLARRIGNGVLVEWKGMPLDRVVAYRVYRATGGGAPQLAAIVENVEHPSFADISAVAGSFSYQVSAVFVPHAVEPEQTPPPPPPSPAGNIPGFGSWISGVAALEAIRIAAPTTTAELETLGGITSQNRDPAGFVQSLRETERSAEVRVVVK